MKLELDLETLRHARSFDKLRQPRRRPFWISRARRRFLALIDSRWSILITLARSSPLRCGSLFLWRLPDPPMNINNRLSPLADIFIAAGLCRGDNRHPVCPFLRRFYLPYSPSFFSRPSENFAKQQQRARRSSGAWTRRSRRSAR